MNGPIVLRPFRPDDAATITYRHRVVYEREYGWGDRFEALVAGVVDDFVAQFDEARERGWMAEIDGRFAGCVLICREPDDDTTARLRLLLVEPDARGRGLGSRLVDACIRFVRQRGYRRLVLWTHGMLDAARRIYERRGFRLTREVPHDLFGAGLVGQTWELDLRAE